jgi:hypothetical protein
MPTQGDCILTTRIDHFMYAVASLDEGMEWAADTFGMPATYGGEHVGLGTRNALLSLGSTYLEIIAPDPAQSHEGSAGAQFADLRNGGLVTWAVEGDLNAIAQALESAGMSTQGPNRTQRKTESGELLVWDLLFPIGSPHGGRMPFFIDWLECTNPKDTNPVGGEFKALAVTTPDADNLAVALRSIDLNITVSAGPPALSVTIDSPRGEVVLASTNETSQVLTERWRRV